MRALFLLLVAAAMIGCGSESGSPQYSSDLSKEVPKPRSDGPDFGAYKSSSPKPGEGPKRLSKGGG